MARLISDCRSAGLVEIDGTVSWLCAPRFDAAPVFASALDDRAGFFSVLVEGGKPEAQRYIDGTLVCETDLSGPDGLVRVTDCLVIDPRGPAAADEAGELIRQIHVVEGRARVGIRIAVRYGFGTSAGRWMRDGRRTRLPGPGIALDLDTDLPLRPDGTDLVAVLDLEKDQYRVAALRWQDAKGVGSDLRGRVQNTATWWRRWSSAHSSSPDALQLRALTFAPTGGVVRSATTSLGDVPADGRLCWMDDQHSALAFFTAVGALAEADRLRGWIDGAGEGNAPRGLSGGAAPAEQGLDHLARPVRTGAPACDAAGNTPWLPEILARLSAQ